MKPPLRGAIIGYGFIMEKGHAAGYAKRAQAETDGGRDVEIVAVADLSRKTPGPGPRCSCPGVRIYEDHAALLAGEQGNLDFVDIAAPPCDHAAIAHAAFEHGLHVFCEKPIATSIDEARSMLDHAADAEAGVLPVPQLQARAGDQDDPRRARVGRASARCTW